MDRREFLKSVLGVGAYGVFGNPLSLFSSMEVPDLVVIKGRSPKKITETAIDAFGGMKRFVSRGDVVVIKPNMAWDRAPEYAANTNPEVVGTLVRLCVEAGAKKVKVFDHTVNDPRRCYVQSGIAEAARSNGAEVIFVDQKRFKDVGINGEVLKSWPLYVDILEADKVINVPILKHHGLAGLTMAFKNWMGVMGGSRGRIHQRLGESLADLALVIKPTLTILDAIRVLKRNGPQGGNLEDVVVMDTIVAGMDQVAVDSYGARLFGKNPEDFTHIKVAARRNLGIMDLSRIKIKTIELS